jgi:hypothetical protein
MNVVVAEDGIVGGAYRLLAFAFVDQTDPLKVYTAYPPESGP